MAYSMIYLRPYEEKENGDQPSRRGYEVCECSVAGDTSEGSR